MFPFEVKYPEDRIAVMTDNGSIFTFGDIVDFTEKIRELIPDRCLLFCLSQNTVGSLFGYISFLSNSFVPVMLNSDINSDFLEVLINTYRPQYLWLPDNRNNEFANYQVVFSAHNYSLVKLEEKNSFALNPDLAILLTTSGSTGSSKWVRISYENLKSNTESISSFLSIDEQERPITSLPMWYAYGLSIINCHLFKGATILLTSKTIVEKDFWNFFKSREASSFSGVPYTYQILKKLKFSEMSLPSLKTLTQAGGKLNNELNIYFSEYALNSDKRFFVMYGQTEATARMSFLPPEYAIEKLGSIGLPLPDCEFVLVDDYGNEIQEIDRVGELVYKGKNVSMGYCKSGDDLLKCDENNGVLFTGDLAKKDADNFYYITGRKNRDIKLFGNRINLDEMENLLTNIITDCACTGSNDNLSVFITDKTRVVEIKNFISFKTGIHPSAFSVKYCNEIPKNTVGKINYSMLESL
jgi:acyl-coenzyme A synthetase/AMP-(fatty) acid ligase